MRVSARFPAESAAPESCAVRRIALAPDGARVATCDDAGQIVVRTRLGGVCARLALAARADTLTLAPDGRLLTVVRGETRWWDAATGAPAGSGPDVGRFGELTLSPDGRSAVSSDPSRVVLLHDLASGATRAFGDDEEHDHERANMMTPTAVAFSPDGRRIATARWDQAVHVWDLASGELIRQLSGILWVTWAPQGETVACGVGRISKRPGASRVVCRLYSADTGVQLGDLDEQTEPQFAAPDQLVGLVGGMLRAWQVPSGAPISIPDQQACALATAPAAGLIATGSPSGEVVLWSGGITPLRPE